jgi:hypothetical protein
MRIFALVTALSAVTGCSVPLVCASGTCSNGNTVQECVNTNGSVTYNFGGMSCNCSSTGCNGCAQQLSTYCGGTAPSFDGGTTNITDAGAPRDLATASKCSVTLSGPVSGTYSCTTTILYTAGSDLGLLNLQASTSALSQFSLIAQHPGVPASGTWVSSDTGSKATMIVQQNSSGGVPATWTCSIGNGSDQGNYTVHLAIDKCSVITGNDKTCTGSGQLSATLPALAATGASGDLTVTATF